MYIKLVCFNVFSHVSFEAQVVLVANYPFIFKIVSQDENISHGRCTSIRKAVCKQVLLSLAC